MKTDAVPTNAAIGTLHAFRDNQITSTREAGQFNRQFTPDSYQLEGRAKVADTVRRSILTNQSRDPRAFAALRRLSWQWDGEKGGDYRKAVDFVAEDLMLALRELKAQPLDFDNPGTEIAGDYPELAFELAARATIDNIRPTPTKDAEAIIQREALFDSGAENWIVVDFDIGTLVTRDGEELDLGTRRAAVDVSDGDVRWLARVD